jgi:hypothetical protein
MNSTMQFIVYALATWRIASLMTSESGPFDIFLKIRGWAGITHDEDGKVLMIPHKFFAELLSCVWCCSIWVSFFWLVIWVFIPWGFWIAIPFSLSTIAIVIQRFIV